MSQTSKRKKLSLKKPAVSKSSAPLEQPVNTILSMFKKQNDKQTESVTEQQKESGSEGDVVITNVFGLTTDICQSVSKTEPGPGTNDKIKQNQRNVNAKKLSLSGRKRRKIKDRNDTESASDSDFESKVSQRNIKAGNDKFSRSLSSEQDSRKQASPYRLRKRNTVPVVDLADSDTDNEDKKQAKERTHKENGDGDVINNDTKDIETKEMVNGESAMEDIVILPTTGCKSSYFENSKKRKSSDDAGKVKLSLKRSKSGKESQRHSKHSTVEDVDILVADETKTVDDIKVDKLVCIAETDSKVKQTNERNDLPNKPTVELGGSTYSTEEKELKKRLPTATTTVTSVLMKKPHGKKDEIAEDNGRKDSSKGRKSHSGSQRDHNKNNAINDKSNSKTSNQRSLKDKKVGSSAKTDTADPEESNIVGDNNDDDNDNDDTAAVNSEKTEYRVPYYLENFKTIKQSVLDDEENARLFDDIDMKFINTFNIIDESCQKLYVRLFSRKLTWLPMSKVNYPEISENIPELVETLIDAGLLMSGTELSDLPIVLKILSAPDLKALAKSFHINSQGMTKASIIEELLKKGQKSSISTMFKGGTTGTMEKTILSRAKSSLGKVCRLADEPRAVFIRILMLFSLYNTNFDEESGGGGQNQLFQMLMVNIGRVVYPSYTVNRDRSVFQDRAALVRFETALQFEMDIQAMTERGKWTLAHEIYKQAKETGKPVCKNKHYRKWDRDLPQFLRLYTAGSVYTRVDNLGVEILQRLKLYKEAVVLLEELLAQDLYCVQYRGHWYERLALNLEAHLKSVEKSMTVIKRGLLDPTVKTGRRLALYERVRKICEAPRSKFADRINEFEHQTVLPTPEVCIEGMVISDATSVGMKYQFVMHGDSDSVTLCAVEELVLEHYKQNGYPEGLHAEGSVVSNLFVLLFWDIMFIDVPNAFHGPFQSCPLDIATQDFYINRQQHVDERLEWIKHASLEELHTEVGRVWSEHEGKMCSGINWDKFSGPDTHQNLISCMGGLVIAGVLERYVKDPRHTRSGFPDLTLWNSDTKQFKICEVKGPNDRLSYKQILWIDYLLKLGVDAEVCYVKAVGSKKLKPAEKHGKKPTS